MTNACFIARCTCGILYRIEKIDEVFDCGSCGKPVTIAVDHADRATRNQPKMDWFREG